MADEDFEIVAGYLTFVTLALGIALPILLMVMS
jgi:thiol:disulfide interchange protein